MFFDGMHIAIRLIKDEINFDRVGMGQECVSFDFNKNN
jgi:hypothetical protein